MYRFLPENDTRKEKGGRRVGSVETRVTCRAIVPPLSHTTDRKVWVVFFGTVGMVGMVGRVGMV